MGFSMVTGSGNRFQYQYNRQRGQIVILLIGRKGGWRGDLEHLVLSASHPSCLLSADQVSDTVETEVQGWRWLEDTSTNHWSLYSRRECGSKALLWIFSLSILLGKWGPDLFFFFFFQWIPTLLSVSGEHASPYPIHKSVLWEGTIIIPILQVGKLRLREIKLPEVIWAQVAWLKSFSS